MASTQPLWAVPIPSRRSVFKRPRQVLRGTLFCVFFSGITIVGSFVQLLLTALIFPLRIVSAILGLSFGRRLQDLLGRRFIKGLYATGLVMVSQWFAPTHIVLSLEGDNNLRPQDVLVRDSAGKLIGLELPKKLVIMSNHQIYADWIYMWCLAYYFRMETNIFIILKKSLKWVPVVGWSMQIFGFLFLARSWAADRQYLARKLRGMAAWADREEDPLALLIFPEGTLVSSETRPLSKKFADKMGIDDMAHTLLPRATGLQYVLRALSPHVPSLHLLDITVAYPGIPRSEYGQSYYTLRSIFIDGIPPPRIHVHMKLYNVRLDVPIGTVTFAGNDKEAETSEKDRERFEQWIQRVWREKDERLELFYKTGSLASETSHIIPAASGTSNGRADGPTREIEFPIKLRSGLSMFNIG